MTTASRSFPSSPAAASVGPRRVLFFSAVLPCFLVLPSVRGWTPRVPHRSSNSFHHHLPPANNNNCGERTQRGRSGSTSLSARSNDRNEEDGGDETDAQGRGERSDAGGGADMSAYRARLEAVYSWDSVDDDDDRRRVRLDEWWDADAAVEAADHAEELDWVNKFCAGGECEQQCEIPTDFKNLLPGGKQSEQTVAVDVLAFLGIPRAEPLRVLRDWD